MPTANDLDSILQELSTIVDIIRPVLPKLLNYFVEADTSYRNSRSLN